MRIARGIGIIAIALTSLGCGPKAAAPPPAAPGVQQPSTLLPEWAPKDPSPEFLRAATVLKPMPAEKIPGFVGTAEAARLIKTYPAAWEFFGTLTDEQVHEFLTHKPVNMPGEDSQTSSRVLIPVKSMTSKQRAALNKYFEVWREAMSGAYNADDRRAAVFSDRLVALYKFGAKEDLSNLDAGFNVASHSVNITFRIHKPDGTVISGFGCTIASI